VRVDGPCLLLGIVLSAASLARANAVLLIEGPFKEF